MSDDTGWSVLCVVAGLCGLMLGAIGGIACTAHYWQSQAIEHNAAKWTVDEQTGHITFTWLTDPERSEP